MLGLGDFWVSSVFILIILSTLLCVVYGAMNWNKGAKNDEIIEEEQKKWEEDEEELEKSL